MRNFFRKFLPSHDTVKEQRRKYLCTAAKIVDIIDVMWEWRGPLGLPRMGITSNDVVPVIGCGSQAEAGIFHNKVNRIPEQR